MLIWPRTHPKLVGHDHDPTEESACGSMRKGKPINQTPHRWTVRSSTDVKARWASRPWLLALVLVIITFVVYQPVWHAGFIWDDDLHVTQNVNLRSLHGLYRIWFEPLADQQYYPLQLTGFWIEYHLWGLHPFGYHAVNILLHALNAVLLWMALQQLEVPGAWLAAAVFAVHPVQVKSVAWVSELKNLLSTTFYFAAMLAFFRFRPLTGVSQTHSQETTQWNRPRSSPRQFTSTALS